MNKISKSFNYYLGLILRYEHKLEVHDISDPVKKAQYENKYNFTPEIVVYSNRLNNKHISILEDASIHLLDEEKKIVMVMAK